MVNLNCEHCGRAYEKTYLGPSHLNSRPTQTRSKYCTMGCQAKAKKARDKARDANKPKSGPFVPKPIDPEVLKVIRLAAAAGKSLIEIKDSLERLDIRNQLNRTFSVTQIKRIVQGHDE